MQSCTYLIWWTVWVTAYQFANRIESKKVREKLSEKKFNFRILKQTPFTIWSLRDWILMKKSWSLFRFPKIVRQKLQWTSTRWLEIWMIYQKIKELTIHLKKRSVLSISIDSLNIQFTRHKLNKITLNTIQSQTIKKTNQSILTKLAFPRVMEASLMMPFRRIFQFTPNHYQKSQSNLFVLLCKYQLSIQMLTLKLQINS